MSLNSYAFSDKRRFQTLNKCTGPLGWISTVAIFLYTILLKDEASKTLYISFLQLSFDFVDVAWVEAHKGVAKSSEPKIHEGVLVFKCSDNLVPRCLSTLQEKGLCTILVLEERKNLGQPKPERNIGKITFQVDGETIIPFTICQ